VTPLTPAEILEYLPHRRPFRFVDEVVEVSAEHSVCRYTFRADESFYAGHFPGYAVTPGVILLETMCQGAAVLGLHLLSLDRPREELFRYDSIMTDSELELSKPVYPGDTVECRAQKVLWRHGKLRVKSELMLRGELAALAVIGGMSVKDARARA
jgi:3-hydroxyacyl-[acyl-carrier-protein] dehydratase